MTNKEKFIEICKANIARAGIDDLLNYLDTTDFFTAPASTKFHGNYEGGLLEHSLNVYDNILKVVGILPAENKPSLESLTIVSLFHDICKANFYKKGSRNVKDEITGKWFAKEVYEINDQFPLGHGEKSCIMLERFMRLTANELLAIRWHMGGWDCSSRGGDYGMSAAQDITPLVTILQVADMLATLYEKKI